MNRQVVVRMVVVLFALLGLSLFPLKAQKYMPLTRKQVKKHLC